MHQDVSASVGKQNDEAHDDERQIVVPAGSFVAPEAGVPNEDLFVNCSQHYQDQTDGGELLQNPKHDSQGARQFGHPKEHGEPFAHADALATLGGIRDVAPAAGDENDCDHQAKQK